ncbi:Uncharacterised protein [Segatella copri]|nr:Uncharacterised protein [Segatella copri]
MVDTLNHLVRDLLTNLNTCVVSSLLLVVTSVGTIVKTLDEIIHVSSINAHALYHKLLQTLSLRHTHSIAHSIYISLEICLRSRIATTYECCSSTSHEGSEK